MGGSSSKSTSDTSSRGNNVSNKSATSQPSSTENDSLKKSATSQPSSIETEVSSMRSSNQTNTSQTSYSLTTSDLFRSRSNQYRTRPFHFPANQSVKYSVNNYAIPKAQKEQPGSICLPPKSLPDKFGLRVCPQYNSKVGCNALLCRRFHVCQHWVLKTCHRANCHYDHSFTSVHNNNIICVFSERRDINIYTVPEVLQKNHKQSRKPEMKDNICIYSIMQKCTRKSCPLVHNNKPYQWQLLNGNKWILFSHQQSDYLEQLYCHPAQVIVELPQFPSHLSECSGLKELGSLLSKAQSWYVDLENMVLRSRNDSFYMQRLSTPSDITCDFNLATRWIWYWEDDGVWKPYIDGVEQYFVIAFSDQLEHHLQFGQKNICQVKIGGYPHEINIYEKIQRNLVTGKLQKVRRRPVCRMQDHDLSFSRMFSSPCSKIYMLLPVLPVTSEFIYIEKMMTASLCNIRITSIQRIQNDYLWKTYQIKKRQLLSLYCNDTSQLNEQYLFHGTKHSVIDKICRDNLDWRLFGSNIGNVFGRGTYFSNKASVADKYSETDAAGLKAVFVVIVSVGTMTVGSSDMDFPPENPKTGRCFDTTCNDKFNSTMFVKYHRDEFYPAYLVKYCHT